MRQQIFANSNSRASRQGVALSAILIGAAIIIVGGLLAWTFFGGGSKEAAFNPILAEVTQGEFVSQVLDQGEIQSSDNVEIRCEVKSRNGQVAVLKVIPEGTRVKEGDFLVQLDSTQFEKELEQQNIAMANARTQVIQAETSLASAKATLNEYLEGIYVEAQQLIKNEIYDADSQIATAQSELQQAEAVYENSDKLHAKGFITSRQLEADDLAVSRSKISLQKARNSLDLAKQKQIVLRDITKPKNEVELKANIEAAIVKLDSENDSFKVEQQKLEDVKVMITKCKVVVPPGVAGQVVYAKESSRRGDEWVLEEGANVRESQVLVRLPDPTKMEVKALINEQSITQIEPNMPVSIKVDALNDTTLKGVVTKVSQYAESSGWMSTTVRKYAVNVRIIDPPLTLKPGMNASCAIQTRFEKDAVMTPLQTIYGVQDRQFCLVRTGDEKWETRELVLAGDNSQVALVSEGLKKGDEVVMNPGAYKSRMDLPELELDAAIEIPDSELNKDIKPATDGPSGGYAGGQGQGGRPGGQAGGGRPGGQAGGGRPGGQAGGGRPGGSGQAGGGRPSGGGGGFGGGGMPSASSMADSMMKRSDTNSDGKIDADELASMDSRMKSRLETADTDGDGSISKEEMKAGVEKMMKSWSGGGGGGGRPGRTPAPAGSADNAAGSTN